MKVSIIEMGKTKKRNVRESIISVLSREFPLSIRKIYNSVKRDYHLDMTYQAVFKLVKGMVEDGILEKSEKEYKLNVNWIKQLEDELRVIRANYGAERGGKVREIQDNISKFVAEVGPKIKEYIGEDKSCILGISGGGRFFGMALWKYLAREGIDSKYVDYDPVEEAAKKGIGIKKEDAEGRKMVIVDSAIYGGKTYEAIMRKVHRYKGSLKVKEIKYAVDKDMAGLADFARIKG